jgi:hypothetical protein
LKTDCSVPSTVLEDVQTQPTLVAATLGAVARSELTLPVSYRYLAFF